MNIVLDVRAGGEALMSDEKVWLEGIYLEARIIRTALEVMLEKNRWGDAYSEETR